MKVADLQQHLADLARWLGAAGAGKVGKDLEAIREGLAPFREQSLTDFAAFLSRAETYARTGEVPLKGRAAATTNKPRATRPKPPATDTEPLAREVQHLYDRAADPTVTREMIETTVARLKPLKKPELVTIADRIGLLGQSRKTLEQIRQGIQDRILARKGATQRAGLIDRPEFHEADWPPATSS